MSEKERMDLSKGFAEGAIAIGRSGEADVAAERPDDLSEGAVMPRVVRKSDIGGTRVLGLKPEVPLHKPSGSPQGAEGPAPKSSDI
jgi:hypothetical protein